MEAGCIDAVHATALTALVSNRAFQLSCMFKHTKTVHKYGKMVHRANDVLLKKTVKTMYKGSTWVWNGSCRAHHFSVNTPMNADVIDLMSVSVHKYRTHSSGVGTRAALVSFGKKADVRIPKAYPQRARGRFWR